MNIKKPYTPKEFKISSVRDCAPISSPCNDSSRLFNYWQDNIPNAPWFGDNREHLIVVLLNTRLRSIGHHLVSIGLCDEAHYHPREVLRPAIIHAAYGFAIMHNHPSGDPTPSHADSRITANLKEASNLMQIHFIDHVVVGNNDGERCPYFSFKDAGYI